MKMHIKCYPCLISMIVKICELAAIDDAASKEIMHQTFNFIVDEGASVDTKPPFVAAKVYEIARTVLNLEIFDPYKALKVTSNNNARKLVPRIRDLVTQSDDKFIFYMRLIALANIIDFGIISEGAFDLSDEIKNMNNLKYGIDQIELLREKIEKANTLLYLADNSGEVIFDELFIEYLTQEYKELKIVFAARNVPILNDVTIDDAHDLGIDKFAELISSGCSCPGINFDQITPEFKNIYESADIVISKGQGNFETLMDVNNDRLFHIFRVKCRQVEKVTGCLLDSLMIMNNGDFNKRAC